jgi:OTU-like cysteine protease
LLFSGQDRASKSTTQCAHSSLINFPGFVINSVPFDGNCMFAALADQLYCTGIDSELRSHFDLRCQLVGYILSSSALTLRIAESMEDGDTVEEYLNHMKLDGTWGDGNILSAASLLFKTRIEIHTANQSNPMIIENDGCEEISSKHSCLTLGFVSEVPGKPESHYISLRVPVGMQNDNKRRYVLMSALDLPQ